MKTISLTEARWAWLGTPARMARLRQNAMHAMGSGLELWASASGLAAPKPPLSRWSRISSLTMAWRTEDTGSVSLTNVTRSRARSLGRTKRLGAWQ